MGEVCLEDIEDFVGNIKPLFPWPPPAPSYTQLSPAPGGGPRALPAVR